MAKRRSVVAGWDPTFSNPNGTTGRPKGVQTVSDMRVGVTFDILGDGIIAKHGVPTLITSPTNIVTITPFMAAILSSKGGYYTPSISSNEQVTLNLSNTGAVKIYVQQKDYEVDPAAVDSEVTFGVAYGAAAIPAGALLLFTSTLSGQTSTSGMTFTPAFKYTGAASGTVRVPTQADLANVTVIQAGTRALVTSGANIGEYFYTGSAWQQSSLANPKLDGVLSKYFESNGDLKSQVLKLANIDQATFPRFSVYQSAALDTGSGAYTHLAFQSERYDTHNAFATGKYTVPVSGLYSLNWTVAYISGTNDAASGLFVNGVHTMTGGEVAPVNVTTASVGTCDLILNAGDVLEIRSYVQTRVSSAGRINTEFQENRRTWFQGRMVLPLAP